MKQLLGFLLLVGFLLTYWHVIVPVLFVVLIVCAFPQAWREHQQERQEKARAAAAVAARAVQQDQWYLTGDLRGTFG